MLLIGHSKSVIHEGVKIIFPNFLIANINFAIEPRKIYIDPVGVFSFLIKKKRIFYNASIQRIFKRIRVRGIIKFLICFLGEFNFKITSWLYCIIAVAGDKNKKKKTSNTNLHSLLD